MARKSNKSSINNLSSDVSMNDSKSSSSSRSVGSSIDYRQLAMDLINNPTVRYMAGGVATAMLTRFANRLDVKYPEISSFLRENITTLEGKLDEFKGGNRSERDAEARH